MRGLVWILWNARAPDFGRKALAWGLMNAHMVVLWGQTWPRTDTQEIKEPQISTQDS